jgi:hypothetical protein
VLLYLVALLSKDVPQFKGALRRKSDLKLNAFHSPQPSRLGESWARDGWQTILMVYLSPPSKRKTRQREGRIFLVSCTLETIEMVLRSLSTSTPT